MPLGMCYHTLEIESGVRTNGEFLVEREISHA